MAICSTGGTCDAAVAAIKHTTTQHHTLRECKSIIHPKKIASLCHSCRQKSPGLLVINMVFLLGVRARLTSRARVLQHEYHNPSVRVKLSTRRRFRGRQRICRCDMVPLNDQPGG